MIGSIQFMRALRAAMMLVLVLGTAVAANDVQAQETPETRPTDSAGAVAAVQSSYIGRSKPVYNMVIFGDVLGTGLWAGMNRVAEEEDRFTITGRIQENSGLARPKLYNWPAAAAKVLEANEFDVALVMLGANDARDISTPEGRVLFGSAEWKERYANAVRQMISVIRQRNVAIYWFGVPPMARSNYNEAMKVVASVERQVTAEEGIRYIDLGLLLVDENGLYADSGDDGTGEITRLRSRNGIKFITRGNDRLAFELMKLVRADIAVADGQQPAPVVTSLAPAPQISGVAGDLPMFSAPRADGLDVEALASASLPGPGYVQVAKAGKAGTSGVAAAAGGGFLDERNNTAPETTAGKLFNEGLWPEAPTSRADAFNIKADSQAQ